MTPQIFNDMLQRTIILSDRSVQTKLKVRVANNRRTRIAGYQNVCPHDAGNTAMLFVFPYAIDAAFHMNNVHFNLDIAFFDADGRVVNTQLMEQAQQGQASKVYKSKKKAKFALELPAGRWRALSLSEEARLIIPD